MLFPRRLGIRVCLAGVVALCLASSASPAASDLEVRGEEVLAYAEPWRNAADYAWSRESATRVEGDKEPSLRIQDVGRFRVEFVKFEEDSAIFNVWILQYKYQTQLAGKPVKRETSPLEGKKLPMTWLHWALGFSSGTVPGKEAERIDSQQASQVLELVDFRGFVPRKIPKPREEWPFKVTPDRGQEYAVKEELERKFRCDAVDEVGDVSKCKVAFTETLKMTPQKPGRSWQVDEREGVFWVTLPEGLIEAAEWKMVSTESIPRFSVRSKIQTETKVTLTRVEKSEDRKAAPRVEKRRTGKPKKDAPPLPPR